MERRVVFTTGVAENGGLMIFIVIDGKEYSERVGYDGHDAAVARVLERYINDLEQKYGTVTTPPDR